MGELADRVRALKDNKQAYLDLGEDEPDEQILQTAAEIDGNMTYLGLDDAIVQLASEVAALEGRELPFTMADVIASVEIEDGSFIVWRCPECRRQVLCIWGDEMESVRMQQTCPHSFDEPEWKIISPATVEDNADELMLRVADAWDIFLHLSSRAEEAFEETPDWLDRWISRLEFALKGDPGHQEPAEFQARRRDRLYEHGPRLQWGASQITEMPEDSPDA